MNKIFSILIVLFLTIQFISGQEHLFRQYGAEYGLENSFLYSINQDNDGFLWVGTGEGLFKFNGYEFIQYTDQDSLAENFVTNIFKDSTGKIWVGHMSGGITQIADNRFNIPVEASAYNSSITSIIESDSGKIWIATQNEGVLLFDNENHVKEIRLDLQGQQIYNLYYLGANYFLLGTGENLYIAEFSSIDNTISIKIDVSDFPLSRVADIIPDPRGGIIILSKDAGIYKLNVNLKDLSYELKLVLPNIDGNLDNIIQGLLIGEDNVWVATMGSGIIKIKLEDTGEFSFTGNITEKNGLNSNNVRCIYKDFEGNIWLGMYGEGLLRYIDDNLKFYSFESRIGSDKIYALSTKSNRLCFASENRLVFVSNINGEIVKSVDLPPNFRMKRINSILYADDGKVYLGAENSGLVVFNETNSSYSTINLSGDNLQNTVNYITESEGNLWIGTMKGVCKLNLSNGSKKWFTTNEGLPHNNITSLFIDSKGRVLIGTICKNVYFIDKDDEVKFDPKLRFSGLNSIVSFIEDSEKDIWIATSGSGVFRYMKEDTWNYTRTSTAGLLSDYCYSMVYNNKTKVLVGHRGGFSQIDSETQRVKTYAKYEGIKSSAEFYTNSAVRDEFNSIWFGTSAGVIKFMPDLTSKGLTPPLIHIDGLKINDITYTIEDNIVLEPGFYDIEFLYTAINFSNPELVNYQSMLEGYTPKWNFTSLRSVTYNRVGHGSYSFKLRAFNEYDIPSSNPATVNIRIKKPVYLSGWFYLVVIVALGISLYIFIKARERNLINAQQKLIQNLDNKTKELIAKEEIIKERKKNEVILIEAKEKAELSDKLKTSFLANMSHEIRTPMNAIVGFSELLKDIDCTIEERLQYIDTIMSNSQQLTGLLDDIFDISIIESNQLKLKNKECNIGSMYDELLSSYSKIIDNDDQKSIKIAVSKDVDITILTDCTRLRQVFTKLLDNAVKFTDSGSIKFGYNVVANSVLFYVEDTGIGMAADKMQIIFDLFRKVEDNKLRLYRGTGLGLSLSQNLVRLMGGELEVESEEGKGSRFFFALPCDPSERATYKEIKSSIETEDMMDFSDKQILIVEDDSSNFLLLNEVLKFTKAKLLRAENGTEAMEIYHSNKGIDLILMDIKLPGIDGYEVTRRIREIDKDIPIIAHTAFAMAGDKDKALEAGCNDYISKPIDKAQLFKAILRLI